MLRLGRGEALKWAGTPEVWPISGLAGGKFAGQSPFRRKGAEGEP